MKIIQDYIIPVVRLSRRDNKPRFEMLHGTAFFVNSNGVFITASHVIQAAKNDVDKNGGHIALVMRNAENAENVYSGKIQEISFADPPYDIAVGVVSQPSSSCFVFVNDVKTWAWTDVYTAGYPATAVADDLGKFRIDVRSHKGYILRKLPPGKFLMHEHPAVIEVNFSIPKGLSGAPLMLRWDNYDGHDSPPFILVGVCCGNQPSEVVDHAITDIDDNGVKFEERVSRIEEYGIIHDLRPLIDWKPTCLGGLTLGQAVVHNP
jgi:Trypsin-like peptidase domain